MIALSFVSLFCYVGVQVQSRYEYHGPSIPTVVYHATQTFVQHYRARDVVNITAVDCGLRANGMPGLKFVSRVPGQKCAHLGFTA